MPPSTTALRPPSPAVATPPAESHPLRADRTFRAGDSTAAHVAPPVRLASTERSPTAPAPRSISTDPTPLPNRRAALRPSPRSVDNPNACAFCVASAARSFQLGAVCPIARRMSSQKVRGDTGVTTNSLAETACAVVTPVPPSRPHRAATANPPTPAPSPAARNRCNLPVVVQPYPAAQLPHYPAAPRRLRQFPIDDAVDRRTIIEVHGTAEQTLHRQ